MEIQLSVVEPAGVHSLSVKDWYKQMHASFKTFGSSLILGAVFGDKPFQVSLVRNMIEPPPETGDVNPWQWSVELPLDNQIVEQQFSSILMGCIQVTDPNQAAVVNITAQPTRIAKTIGYEVEFSFVNASFSKRGKRKLQKMFTRVYESWLAAKQAVSWSWEKGLLPAALEGQVAFCCSIDPGIVNKIVVGVRRLDPGMIHLEETLAKEGAILLVPGVVLLHDIDHALSQSGFGEAIVKKLAPVFQDLIKQGMVESMELAQREFIEETPQMLIEVLTGMAKKLDQMKALGIDVKCDPRIAMLKITLENHIKDGQHTPEAATSDAKSNTVAVSAPTPHTASDPTAGANGTSVTGEQQPAQAATPMN